MRQNPPRSVPIFLPLSLIYMIPSLLALTSILLLLSLSPQITTGEVLEYRSFPLMGVFQINFLLDRLSLSFGVFACSIYLLIAIYSVSCIRTHRLRYCILLAVNLLSILGLILSRDLLGFYIFFETISISAYFLIIHSRGIQALDAGYKYIVMMLVGGLFIFMAMMVAFVAPVERGSWSRWVGICFSIGCLLKAGAFPFHTWLPDAHPAAPAPVSALLSGMMTKVGVYGLVRAFSYPGSSGGVSDDTREFLLESLRSLPQSVAGTSQSVFEPAALFVFTGALSMVIGVSLALVQRDLKRLLAYHSISQIGYILLGIGLGGSGLAGGLLHIFSHAMFKGLLFLAVGAVVFRTRIRRIDLLGGLWRRMPVTTFTCIIAALSISGAPLTSGYASKGIIFESIKGKLFLQIIFVFTSAGTCASFLKLVRHTFFGKPNSPLSHVKEVSGSMYVPMILLAIASFALGVLPTSALNLLLGSFAPETHLWTSRHLIEALLSLGMGFALYALLLRGGIFGFGHSEDTRSGVVIPRWLGLGHVPGYVSVDRFYSYIVQAVFALGAKLEEAHRRSLSVCMQMVISFLVIVILAYSIALGLKLTDL